MLNPGPLNIGLYTITVLIWGSTWYAITFQLGTVAVEVSLFYRFGLAAVILLAFCLATKRSLKFSARDHATIAAQGFFLFSINYFFFYIAQTYLTSALVAIGFSTIVFYNVVLGAMFFKTRVCARVVIGGLIGLFGLGLVFRPELKTFDLADGAMTGLGITLFATLLASLGNMASVKNQKKGISVIAANALGMTYGAVFLLILIALRGTPFTYEATAGYTLSLLYLAVFGSVIAFGSYLSLLGRIGADRAAYATVLFPVVALALSSVFENYQWTGVALLGFAFVLAGNVLALGRRWTRTKAPAAEAAPRLP